MPFAKAKDIGNVRIVTINTIPSFNVTAIYILIYDRKEKCGVMENVKLENAVSGVICVIRIVVDNKYIRGLTIKYANSSQ
jgi:predicted Rdx family selenoprotein